MEMLPILTKYEKANSDVMEMEDRKQTLHSEIQTLEGTIEVSRNVITSINRSIGTEKKRGEVTPM